MIHTASILSVVLATVVAFGQSPELVQEHASLTRDCRSVRGHAKRVVEESSVMEMNRDVALAHAREVVKSLQSMEEGLREARALLTAAQLKQVASEQAALEKSCALLKSLAAQIVQELEKENPDRLAVRSRAMKLRDEMTASSAVHTAMKKKLGIRE